MKHWTHFLTYQQWSGAERQLLCLVGADVFEDTTVSPAPYCLIPHLLHLFTLPTGPYRHYHYNPLEISLYQRFLILGSFENITLSQEKFSQMYIYTVFCMQLPKLHKPLDDQYYLKLMYMEEGMES